MTSATWRRVMVCLALVGVGLVGVRLFVPPMGADAATPSGSGSPTSGTRVLFLGNSLTSVNDLPRRFAALAEAGGHRVYVERFAPDGWTLGDHAASPTSRRKVASVDWDYVVLQEQSQYPAVGWFADGTMFPPARTLVGRVRAVGAQPLLYQTWARRDGWPQMGVADYATMQRNVDQTYVNLAAEQHATVAPVGYAWWQAVDTGRTDLWQPDGNHPTVAGTYLAACVFYATVFRQSPVGLGHPADVPAATAATLQRLAATAVFNHPREWNP
jgi:hypothetical protein